MMSAVAATIAAASHVAFTPTTRCLTRQAGAVGVRLISTATPPADAKQSGEREIDDVERAIAFKNAFAEMQGVTHMQFVDCSSSELYHRAHFLGAIPLGEDRRTTKSAMASRYVLSQAEMESLMAELKIGPDTYVFAYDSNDGLFASRLVWTMQYYGHDKAFVPSGGWNEWLRQRHPIGCGTSSMEAHEREPSPQAFVAKPDHGLMALAEDLEDPMVQVIDVRSEAEFTGDNPGGNPRGGHVPGARHLDWRLLCDRRHPEYLKTPLEREDLISSIGGLDRSRPVATVCQSGQRSAFAAIALSDLGYQVANYDAGMAEWLSDSERKIETGQ